MGHTTIEDVAKAAGVSTFTVSRALRGKDHVAAATREKVLRVAQELNYTISRTASSLASGQTHRIALLARDRVAGWFIGELLDGMLDILGPEQYDTIIYRAGSTEEREAFFTNLPAKRNADALVITGFPATEQEENILRRLGMPIISVNSRDVTCCQGSISIDDSASEATLIRYLAALGHKRFCYVGRRDPLTGKQWGHDERVVAYLDTTKQMGLQNCGMYHISLDDPRSVQQAIATMLSLPDRPTAICAWSDYYALAVIHELQRSGIRVPEDMSVAGHDGSDVATGFGITTMAQPAREIGRMTAKTTLALINQEPLPEKRITVQTTLEPGSTTAAITQDNN